MTRKHVWGIDIGSSAVRAVKLVRTQEGIRLADYDIRELSYLGRDDERILEAVRKALIGLAGRKSLIGERVVVSVSGSLSFQRVVKLPPCPLGKIPEMMRYEAQQQIPFSLDDVIWDYQLVSDPADVSQGRKVALFALPMKSGAKARRLAVGLPERANDRLAYCLAPQPLDGRLVLAAQPKSTRWPAEANPEN